MHKEYYCVEKIYDNGRMSRSATYIELWKREVCDKELDEYNKKSFISKLFSNHPSVFCTKPVKIAAKGYKYDSECILYTKDFLENVDHYEEIYNTECMRKAAEERIRKEQRIAEKEKILDQQRRKRDLLSKIVIRK